MPAWELLWLAGLIPLLLAGCVLVVRDPLRLALPLYAFSVPFGSAIQIGSSPFSSLSSILGLLLGAGLVLRLMSPGHGNLSLSPSVGVWMLLLGLTAASALWSVNPGTTIISACVLGSLVLVFVLLALADIDRSTLRRFESAVIAAGVLTTCYGLLQLTVLGGLPVSPAGSRRFGNDLLGPNNQAAALVLPLAMVLDRGLTTPDRGRRIAYLAAAGLLAVGILMTGSRGGVVAGAVTVGAILLVNGQSWKVRLRVVGGVVLFTLLLLLTNPSSIGTRTVTAEGSTGRTDIWLIGLNACRTYCLTGSGWGTFPEVYQQVLPETPGAIVFRGAAAFEPHNIWLLVLIEAGVVGLALLLAGIAVGLRAAIALPSSLRPAPLAGLAGTIASAVFLSNLEFKFFWLALSYVVLSQTVVARTGRSPTVGSTEAANARPVR